MLDPVCLICRKQRGEFAVPGGALYLDDQVYASHAHMEEGLQTIYLGWLVIETRRHTPGLPDLSDSEGQALGLAAARLSRALKACTGAEHIYAFVLGHGLPHFHLHLIARYPGAPREYWGVHVDEWPEAPHGGWAEVESLARRIQAELAGQS